MKINTIDEGQSRVHYLLLKLVRIFEDEDLIDSIFSTLSHENECYVKFAKYIYITPFETQESYPVIGGTRSRDAIHYEISVAKVVLGNRDEPDDVEINQVAICNCAEEAAKKAIMLYVENCADGILTNISEEEMAQEIVDEEEKLSKDCS